MADTVAPAEAQEFSAAGRYSALETERDPFLRRARDVAKVTIPSLMPENVIGGSATLYTPFQGVGARGVNNLAAKILLALFPSTIPFFKLVVPEYIIDELKQKAGADADVDGDIQVATSKMERAIQKKMDSTNARAILFECIKHLVAFGNGLLAIGQDGKLKFFPLSRYVCKRDLDGNPVEIITKEGLSRRTLSPAARAVVDASAQPGDKQSTTNTLELYTHLTRKDDRTWRIHQEIGGVRIPDSEGFYAADKMAWLPLRWTAVPNEDYGRGHGDEYLGDLWSLESLSQSLVDASTALAKVLFLRDPAGITQKKSLEAPNLSIRDGKATDITVLRVEKGADLSVTQAEAAKIERRLEQAFLIYSTRNAERVTAEEIRLMANELEQTLGGVYSVLAGELQRPYVVRLMLVMQKAKELPAIKTGTVEPQIVTGLDGLGRQSDLQRLETLMAGTFQEFGEPVIEYLNMGEYFKRKAAALSIDTDGLIRPEAQVQAMRVQKQQAAIAATLGPHAIKANAARDVADTKATAAAPPPTNQ